MKTTGAGSKKRSLAEFRKMHKTAGPDSPIYQEGLTMTSVREVKRTGIVSWHEGELDSREDASATVSFGYFRTKTGMPPDVEKAKAAKDSAED